MTASTFPDELDLGYYRVNNPDLCSLSDSELCHHYLQFGRAEGRSCSAVSLREYFVQIAAHHPSVLEIGPFSKPSLIGPNVRYFDVLDSDGLRERARKHGLSTEGVPEIHYTAPNGDLSTVSSIFHAIFSAHVLEHQTCLVSHLKQVSRILPYGGSYFLVIPDKRYCFDYFLSESTIADVLCAFQDQRSSHTLSSVIEHDALTTHNDALQHWQGDHEDAGLLDSVVPRVQAALDRYSAAQGGYIDVHAWQFTPMSFRSIITNLHALSVLDLYPTMICGTPYGRQEFTAVLTKVNVNCELPS